MKKFISFFTLGCMTGLIATNGLPTMAGSCTSHINKTAKVECAEDDSECKLEETKIFNSKENIKSWEL